MRRFILISLACGICASALGQSNEFNRVFEACLKAQSSMNNGEGSKNSIREASHLLSSVIWKPLILEPVNQNNASKEVTIKGHMVFTTEFFNAVANDSRKVYKMAEKYAKEHEKVEMRGDDNVQLCTKCIDAGQSVTYRMRYYKPKIRVAAVAEVNGLINIQVWAQDEVGKVYANKSTSDEYKGMPYRKLEIFSLPNNCNDVVYITVENKYDKPRSVAIIVDPDIDNK